MCAIIYERTLKPKCKHCCYLGVSSDGIGHFFKCNWFPGDDDGWILPCEDLKKIFENELNNESE